MPNDTSDPAALARAAQRKAIRRRRQAKRRESASPASNGELTSHKLSPTQRIGRQGEARAARHLISMGAKLIARNLQCRAGEIDLICVEAGVLAFVEVRQRDDVRFGGAAASVSVAKQRRLACAAAYFLPRIVRIHFGGRYPSCRFDVIAIDGEQLVWLKGVFDSPI